MLSGYSLALVQASWITIAIAFCSLLLGLLFASLFTWAESSKYPFVSWPIMGFVTVLRGLPELLVILFVFFGATQVIFSLTGYYIEINPFLSGTFALSMIFAAYATQIIRGALKAVPRGQRESGKALGFNRYQTFFSLVLPQAVRHALPGLTNQWLVLLKDTALVSLIGVTETLRQAQMSSAATHNSFQWYASAAVIYLLITLASQYFIGLIKSHFDFSSTSARRKT